MTQRVLTQADLDSVAGLSSRDAAERLGVGKSTINDARNQARENGGYLPIAQKEVSIESSVPQTIEQIDAALAARGITRDTHKLTERFSIYDGPGGQPKYSYRVSAVPVPPEAQELTEVDLPTLYAEAKRQYTLRPPTLETAQGKALVVVWADVQVGKTGSRGGTPELIERVQEKKHALFQYINNNPVDEAFFLSVGDEVESFENTPQQGFTNDLSFPDQLDLELTFELEMVRLLASSHSAVTVAGISSNHCRWRAGKATLGKPNDDYGIYLKRQLEKALRLNDAYDHVGFKYANEWDETMVVDVKGTQVGMAHGHQVNNPNNIQKWWTEQAFGNQPLASADVLLTGHFHSFRAQPMGRSQRTGKSRWWLQAPTLDNGSDWYRNLRGDDSDPGLMVFLVDEHGLDLQSLTIL